VSDPEQGGVQHEKTDADARPVLRAVVVLVVTTSLVAAGLVYLTRGLVAGQRAGDPPQAPLAQAAGRLPPEPRLQTHPFADVEALRDSERALLDSYGWVDEKAGVVRLPIERAKELLLERGLPAAGAGPAPQGRP
jgi:hypothetical protein